MSPAGPRELAVAIQAAVEVTATKRSVNPVIESREGNENLRDQARRGASECAQETQDLFLP